MELNWTTFVLEIINFLVLVWILKRFLYQPVLNIIARRRSGIEQQIADAQQLHDEAKRLQAEYENRLADWELERQQLREKLSQELDAERSRLMAELQTALAQEREKAEVAANRQRLESEREIERTALQQGTRFASRLLSQAAGPALESRLLQLLLEELAELSVDRITAIRTQWGETPASIRVASAFPLAQAQQQQLQQVLQQVSGLSVPLDYVIDEGLLAGLRITIGAWVLHINLQDELKDFAEFAHVAR